MVGWFLIAASALAETTVVHKEVLLSVPPSIWMDMFVLRVPLETHNVEASVNICVLSAAVRDQPRDELATVDGGRANSVLHQSVITSQIW